MLVMDLSQVEFGPDPIGSSNQEWLAHSGWKPHDASKPSKAPQHLRSAGGFHGATDPINKVSSGLHIHAGSFVIHGLRSSCT